MGKLYPFLGSTCVLTRVDLYHVMPKQQQSESAEERNGTTSLIKRHQRASPSFVWVMVRSVRAMFEDRPGQSLLSVAHSVTLLKHGRHPKVFCYADRLDLQDLQRLAKHLCDSQNQATPLPANPASKAVLVVSSWPTACLERCID